MELVLGMPTLGAGGALGPDWAVALKLDESHYSTKRQL